MHYSVRHMTRFRYHAPVGESITEVRMQPRSTDYQRCANFKLTVRPAAKQFAFLDHLGNHVHHFTQPQYHDDLSILAESEVEVNVPAPLPAALVPDAWERIDGAAIDGDSFEMLLPSAFTETTARLDFLAQELRVERRGDPLQLLLELNSALHRSFAYDSKSTQVDSPIDEALEKRSGVCQDFTHIMLALLRNHLRIPARYVSGYLHHRRDDTSTDGATHAWIQAWLPELGWVGFDPTNDLLVGERHIEVAVGRDYSDVPPTRGVYKGGGGSDLSVGVRVRLIHEPMADGSTDEITPAYQETAQQLTNKYTQALLALQIQQQQQQQQ